MKVEINLETSNPRTAVLKLDDVDITKDCQAFTLRGRAGQLTELDLEMFASGLALVDVAKVNIVVPDRKCYTCDYWLSHTDIQEPGCKRMQEADMPAGPVETDFRPGPDFGCILWRAK